MRESKPRPQPVVIFTLIASFYFYYYYYYHYDHHHYHYHYSSEQLRPLLKRQNSAPRLSPLVGSGLQRVSPSVEWVHNPVPARLGGQEPPPSQPPPLPPNEPLGGEVPVLPPFHPLEHFGRPHWPRRDHMQSKQLSRKLFGSGPANRFSQHSGPRAV